MPRPQWRRWRASAGCRTRTRLDGGRPLAGERDALRAPAARGGHAHRLRPGDRLRARPRDLRRARISAAPRRLVLDHVGGAALQAGAAPDLRPGVPHLLARSEARRAHDEPDAAAGLWARGETRAAAKPAADRCVVSTAA